MRLFQSLVQTRLLSGAAVIRYKDPTGCDKIQFSILPPVITFWSSRNEGSFRPRSGDHGAIQKEYQTATPLYQRY